MAGSGLRPLCRGAPGEQAQAAWLLAAKGKKAKPCEKVPGNGSPGEPQAQLQGLGLLTLKPA